LRTQINVLSQKSFHSAEEVAEVERHTVVVQEGIDCDHNDAPVAVEEERHDRLEDNSVNSKLYRLVSGMVGIGVVQEEEVVSLEAHVEEHAEEAVEGSCVQEVDADAMIEDETRRKKKDSAVDYGIVELQRHSHLEESRTGLTPRRVSVSYLAPTVLPRAFFSASFDTCDRRQAETSELHVAHTAMVCSSKTNRHQGHHSRSFDAWDR
jgi:hypothetical protein